MAAATLHRERGAGEAFRAREIRETAERQGACRVTRGTLESHISRYCVANNRAGAEKHRKLYRVQHAFYRLYRPGDYYHPDREGGPEAPSAGELPTEYRGLLEWYANDYSRGGAAGRRGEREERAGGRAAPAAAPAAPPAATAAAPAAPPAATAATAVWVAAATLHRERGAGEAFRAREIRETAERQGACRVTRGTLESHISRYCVANNRAGAEKHRKLYRVQHAFYRLYRPGDYYHPDREGGPEAPSAGELPVEYRGLLEWYANDYSRGGVLGVEEGEEREGREGAAGRAAPAATRRDPVGLSGAGTAAPADDKAVIANGETGTVEFKSSLLWNYKAKKKDNDKKLVHAVLKTITAFLNTDGGVLYVGVDDDGPILGLDRDYECLGKRRNWDGWSQKFADEFVDKIGAEYIRDVKIERVCLEGKDVAKITVSRGKDPAYIDPSGDAEFYVRVGTTTRPFNPKRTADYTRRRHFES